MKFVNEKKAVEELECYMYCLQQSFEQFRKKKYVESAFYLENAARSLKELERLKSDEIESGHIVNIIVNSRYYDDRG